MNFAFGKFCTDSDGLVVLSSHLLYSFDRAFIIFTKLYGSEVLRKNNEILK